MFSHLLLKGRARKLKARILVLGKPSDYDRETVNTARIRYMEEAIEMIKSEDIEKEIKSIQENMVAEEELRLLTSSQKEQKPDVASDYLLLCKCGHFKIDCGTVRLIEQVNYAVLDVEIWDKIEEKPLAKKPTVKDLIMQSEWYHTGCNQKLGTIFLYKNVRVPYLAQKSFSFQLKSDDKRRELVNKWNKLPFQVPAINMKELLEYQKALMKKN